MLKFFETLDMNNNPALIGNGCKLQKNVSFVKPESHNLFVKRVQIAYYRGYKYSS